MFSTRCVKAPLPQPLLSITVRQLPPSPSEAMTTGTNPPTAYDGATSGRFRVTSSVDGRWRTCILPRIPRLDDNTPPEHLDASLLTLSILSSGGTTDITSYETIDWLLHKSEVAKRRLHDRINDALLRLDLKIADSLRAKGYILSNRSSQDDEMICLSQPELLASTKHQHRQRHQSRCRSHRAR